MMILLDLSYDFKGFLKGMVDLTHVLGVDLYAQVSPEDRLLWSTLDLHSLKPRSIPYVTPSKSEGNQASQIFN